MSIDKNKTESLRQAFLSYIGLINRIVQERKAKLTKPSKAQRLRVLETKKTAQEERNRIIGSLESSQEFSHLAESLIEWWDEERPKDPLQPDLEELKAKDPQTFEVFYGEEWQQKRREVFAMKLEHYFRLEGIYAGALMEGEVTPDFERFLEDCTKAVESIDSPREVRMLLSIDNFRPGNLDFGGFQTRAFENHELDSLTRRSLFEEHWDYFGNSYLSNLPKRSLSQFHFIYKTELIDGLPGELHKLFQSETRLLQLAYHERLSFPNIIIRQTHNLDPSLTVFDIRSSVPHLSWGVLGDYMMREEALSYIESHSLQKSEQKAFVEFVKLIQKTLPDLSIKNRINMAVFYFCKACQENDEMLSFLLFVIALEGCLLEHELELKEKFALRLALIIGATERARHKLRLLGLRLYKSRSNMVHGNKKFKTEDFIDFPELGHGGLRKDALRNIVRAVILSIGALDKLRKANNFRRACLDKFDFSIQKGNYFGLLDHSIFMREAGDWTRQSIREYWGKHSAQVFRGILEEFLDTNTI